MNKIITQIPSVTNQFPTRCKVAAYARVSSGKDAMLHSLAAQVSYYQNLIQVHPEWEFAGVYADEAMTGTKENRPEFQRMLSDCKNGLIEKVITKSISRFARNTVTLLETVRDLKSIGVDVYFEEQNINSMTGDGELLLTILASYAQEESLSVSENCKWRVRQNFKNGIPGNLRILGYDLIDGHLVINPIEAETVKMVFTDYLSGMGKNAIVQKLRVLGIPTKSNGKWMTSTIHAILRDEKYTGNLLLQKTFINNHLSKTKKYNNGELPQYYIEDSHEAIIPQSLFDEVQKEIAHREKKYMPCPRTPMFSEFTSKIRCCSCGTFFRRKLCNAGTKYAIYKWICSTYNSEGSAYCSIKPIPEEMLKQISAEVLGIDQYDPIAFSENISGIYVPQNGTIEFEIKDRSRISRTWKYRSRSESWTSEMKSSARMKRKER